MIWLIWEQLISESDRGGETRESRNDNGSADSGFSGRQELVQQVINARPVAISHNLETVRELSDGVRSRAKYDISLQVIRQVSESGIVSKSGIMLGLGRLVNKFFRRWMICWQSGVK